MSGSTRVAMSISVVSWKLAVSTSRSPNVSSAQRTISWGVAPASIGVGLGDLGGCERGAATERDGRRQLGAAPGGSRSMLIRLKSDQFTLVSVDVTGLPGRPTRDNRSNLSGFPPGRHVTCDARSTTTPPTAADVPPGLDGELAPVSWAVAISDDYDDAEPRVVLTVEEVGRAGRRPGHAPLPDDRPPVAGCTTGCAAGDRRAAGRAERVYVRARRGGVRGTVARSRWW